MERTTAIPDVPRRPPDAHKTTLGRLLIVGGNTTTPGAPMLAARAAYRSGCGYVTVALPAEAVFPALVLLAEAVGFARSPDSVRDAPCTAFACGMGLGLGADADALVDVLLTRHEPGVFDADALTLLARRDNVPAVGGRGGGRIFTPHPGEMGRLLGRPVTRDDASREQAALEAQRRYGGVVVLKGPRTVVTDGRRLYTNETGSPALATAGTGDVLAGVAGAYLARGMEPFEAAVAAVFRHGLAGERVATRYGDGGLASDVADTLPTADDAAS